jgi:hypothetical protein
MLSMPAPGLVRELLAHVEHAGIVLLFRDLLAHVEHAGVVLVRELLAHVEHAGGQALTVERWQRSQEHFVAGELASSLPPSVRRRLV